MIDQHDAAEYASDEEPSDSEDEALGDAEALEDAEVAAEITAAAGDVQRKRPKERKGMSAGRLRKCVIWHHAPSCAYRRGSSRRCTVQTISVSVERLPHDEVCTSSDPVHLCTSNQHWAALRPNVTDTACSPPHGRRQDSLRAGVAVAGAGAGRQGLRQRRHAGPWRRRRQRAGAEGGRGRQQPPGHRRCWRGGRAQSADLCSPQVRTFDLPVRLHHLDDRNKESRVWQD